MKKINFFTKNIIISLFSLILVFTFSLRKEINTDIREDAINLRRLVPEENGNLSLIILLVFCFWNLIFFVLFICNLCESGVCSGYCEIEDEQPNKLTLIFFSFISCTIAITFISIFIYAEPYSIFSYVYGGIFFIWSMVYLVRCCLHPEIYCTKVCEYKYLKELVVYPLDIYIPCLREDYDKEYMCGSCFCSLLYIYLTAIPYYAFLLIFIPFWLFIKMLVYCNCCNCCYCCEYSPKRKKINKQNIRNNENNPEEHIIPTDNNDQIHISRVRYEFFGIAHFEQNAPENNNNNVNEYNIYIDDDNNN